MEVLKQSQPQMTNEDETILEKAMDILAASSNPVRFKFFKELVRTFNAQEWEGLGTAFSNAKNRLKKDLARQGVNLELAKAKKKARLEEAAKKKAARVEGTPELLPCKKLLPLCSDGPSPWYADYLEEDVVSIDCEFVQFREGTGFVQKCGTVAICNYYGDIIYKATVFWRKSQIFINESTLAINNLDYKDFQGPDTKAFDVVKNEVEQELLGKLIITVKGQGDFESLELTMALFDTFDIQSYYKTWKGTYSKKSREPVVESIKLDLIYSALFKKSIQSGFHSAEADAKGTMRIFREDYVPAHVISRVRNFNAESPDELNKFNYMRLKNKSKVNTGSICDNVQPSSSTNKYSYMVPAGYESDE